MKAKKSHISLRELFRKKLEFAEVTPEAALRAKLMRRVARKEFMHFNPGRFNIFYLGITGIIITASALLFSNSSPAENQSATVIPGKPEGTPEYFEVAASNPLRIKSDKVQVIPGGKVVATAAVTDNAAEISASDQKIVSAPGSVSQSLPGNGIFGSNRSDGKKLKSRPVSDIIPVMPVPSSGCAPLKVQFRGFTESYDSCIWTLGDGGFSNKMNPEWIYDVEGEYKVSLQVFKDSRILSSSATVVVYPRPKAHFEISPEKSIPSNDEVRFLNYSTDATQFKWDFGDGYSSDIFEPSHAYASFGNYNVTLIAFSERGCSDSLTVFNALSGSDNYIDFPNAFIPNEQGPSGGYYSPKSDEAAQVFHPSFFGVSEYQLKIFSKLGIPIFESNDINLGWDGYNKDQLCDPGVYIWKVRGKFRNGEPFIRMGDVTLLKNR